MKQKLKFLDAQLTGIPVGKKFQIWVVCILNIYLQNMSINQKMNEELIY